MASRSGSRASLYTLPTNEPLVLDLQVRVRFALLSFIMSLFLDDNDSRLYTVLSRWMHREAEPVPRSFSVYPAPNVHAPAYSFPFSRSHCLDYFRIVAASAWSIGSTTEHQVHIILRYQQNEIVSLECEDVDGASSWYQFRLALKPSRLAFHHCELVCSTPNSTAYTIKDALLCTIFEEGTLTKVITFHDKKFIRLHNI